MATSATTDLSVLFPVTLVSIVQCYIGSIEILFLITDFYTILTRLLTVIISYVIERDSGETEPPLLVSHMHMRAICECVTSSDSVWLICVCEYVMSAMVSLIRGIKNGGKVSSLIGI